MEKCSAKKKLGKIGFGLFLMMVLWVVGMMALSVLVEVFWPTLVVDMPWTVWLINDIPLYGIGVPVFLLVMKRVPEKGEPEPERPRLRMTVKRFLILLAVCFGSMYLFNMLSGFVVMLINTLTGQPQTNALGELAQMGGIFTNLLFGACVPALGEEFLFRRVLYRKLRGGGDAVYIFASAFCFSVFHGNLQQMLYAFALGAIFAWIYAKTQVIWYTVALHFLINCMGFVVAPLLLENEAALMVYVGIILALVVAAIVVFANMGRRVWAGLAPPSEAGWPVLKPRRWQKNMALQMPPAHYYWMLEEMQYPPHSDDPQQNRQIVYSRPPAVPHPQGGNAPAQSAGMPVAQPPQAQPEAALPAPKPVGIIGFCLGNMGMVLYILAGGALMLLTLFSGLLM